MAFPVRETVVETDFATSVTSMAVNLASRIFFDQFTGVSGTLLDAHAPNVGTSWTKLINVGTGDIGLGGNAADANVAGYSLDEGGLYTADATYPSADYGATCIMAIGDTNDDVCILAVRIQDANNMYAVRFNNTACQLYKRVSGTWSTVGSAGAGVVDASRVTLKISGTTLSFIDDGSTILSETVTDHSAAGKAGLGFGAVIIATDNCSGQSLDNFTVTLVGELCLNFVHVRNAGTWTIPTNWSELVGQAGGGSVGELTIFRKITDGTELGVETFTASTGTTAAWQSLRISGYHGSTEPEVTTSSGDASSADPPSETASWGGSEDNLFIAVAGHSAAVTNPFSAAPSGYSGFSQNGASSGGAAAAVAHGYKNSAADTDNPGTFTVDGSNRWWAAATVVVRPAGGGAATLATNDVALGLSIDATTISQDHVIASQDSSLALSIDNATVSQNHIIVPQDIGLGLTTDDGTVTNTNHFIAVNDVALGLSEDNTTVANTNHFLAVDDVLLSLAEDNTTINQDHLIVVADISLGLTTDEATITQSYVVVVQDIALALTEDGATVTQNHILASGDVTLALTEDATTIAQNHIVVSADMALSLTADNTTVAEEGVSVLDIQDIALGLTTDSATITQNHVIAPNDVALALSEDNATMNQNHVVATADITLALSEDATTVAQDHVLTLQDIVLDLTEDNVTVGQNHVLVANDVSLSLALELASILRYDVVIDPGDDVGVATWVLGDSPSGATHSTGNAVGAATWTAGGAATATVTPGDGTSSATWVPGDQT